MENSKPKATPMELKLNLGKGNLNEQTNEPYRELMGCIIYATITTRPDLCAAANYFSRFQNCYTSTHFVHTKRILRYIQGTLNYKLVYFRNLAAEVLVGYTDSDWAGDKNDRKSTSGYIFKVFGNTVSWMSRKQNTVSLSSTEAKYISLSQGAWEAIWLTTLLKELGIKCNEPTTIFEDKQSSIKIVEEPREHKRMKHIDVKYNFVREAISNGEIQVKYIPSENQVADMMTKSLESNLFQKHRSNLNLVDPQPN